MSLWKNKYLEINKSILSIIIYNILIVILEIILINMLYILIYILIYYMINFILTIVIMIILFDINLNILYNTIRLYNKVGVMLKIICLGTFKGGVGKTMTAFNLAGILAENGKKVLAIDMDAQGNLTNNFGVDRTKDKFKSIKEILENDIDFNEVVIKNPIEELKTLDIIGSSFYLIETEIRLMNRANRENILKHYIEDNKEKFNEYDYVILDTNPSMSIVNQNAFASADSICLVADADLNAIDGIQLFQAIWENIRKDLRIEDNIKAIIVNKYDKRLNICRDFIDFCKEDKDIESLLCDSVIPKNVRLQESVLEAKPINLFDKKSPGYEAYADLTVELEKRGVL